MIPVRGAPSAPGRRAIAIAPWALCAMQADAMVKGFEAGVGEAGPGKREEGGAGASLAPGGCAQATVCKTSRLRAGLKAFLIWGKQPREAGYVKRVMHVREGQARLSAPQKGGWAIREGRGGLGRANQS